MKRVFALVLILICIAGTALANDFVYIANPNPADRLHLRTKPGQNSESLGKYYNGAPVVRNGYFNHNGWAQVKVGLGAASLTGYMSTSYLSPNPQANAMPQYTSVKKVTAYQQPQNTATKLTIPGGRLLSLMGFTNDWWHLLVHTNTSEGDYACFVPANADGLILLNNDTSVNVYISNPDRTDRLHLRTQPSVNSKSLGKYYNGCIATLKGFAEDGEWIKVELYGRTGYMKREFVFLEGQGSNPTYYGIPTVSTTVKTNMYQNTSLTGTSVILTDHTSVEILGLVDDEILHVRCQEQIGYLRWKDTNFVD